MFILVQPPYSALFVTVHWSLWCWTHQQWARDLGLANDWLLRTMLELSVGEVGSTRATFSSLNVILVCSDHCYLNVKQSCLKMRPTESKGVQRGRKREGFLKTHIPGSSDAWSSPVPWIYLLYKPTQYFVYTSLSLVSEIRCLENVF